MSLCNVDVPQLADLKLACFQVFSFWAANSPSASQLVKLLKQKDLLYAFRVELLFTVSEKLPINSLYSQKTKTQTLMAACLGSSWSALLAQESSLVAVCATAYLQVHTHRHWLLLFCCPSRVKNLSCRRKNLKTLGFCSYRQYRCNCTLPPLMYPSKQCMILNTFQSVLLWDTQHSDAG